MSEKLGKVQIIVETIVFNLGVVVLLLLFFQPRYEGKSDIIMQTILYNVNDLSNMGYLVFSNVILGKFLAAVQMLFSILPIYTSFHYGMIFIALCITTYITSKRNINWSGKILSAFVVLFIGYECYININYMKTAMLLIATGYYVLIYAAKSTKKIIFWCSVFVFLQMVGSLICFSAFVISTSIFLLVMILYYGKRIIQLKNKKLIVMTVGVAVILIAALKIIDIQCYKQYEQWNSIAETKPFIERLYSYGAGDYSYEYQEKYEIGEDEYDLMRQGLITKESSMTPEIMNDLFVENNRKAVSLESILDYFREVPISVFELGMFYCWFVLGMVLLLSSNSRNRILLGTDCVILLIAYYPLYIFNASDSHWINAGVFILFIYSALIKIQKLRLPDRGYVGAWLCVLGLLLFGNFSTELFSHSQNDEIIFNAIREMGENEDNGDTYAVEMIKVLGRYSPLSTHPKEFYERDNMYYLDSFYYYYPYMNNSEFYNVLKNEDAGQKYVFVSDYIYMDGYCNLIADGKLDCEYRNTYDNMILYNIFKW